jgi:LPXTG-site transpeptidase (sortase) family protein
MGGQNTYGSVSHVTEKPWSFLAVFLSVFFLASVFLFVIDFVPEPIIAENVENQTASTVAALEEYPLEEPVRVVAPAIGLDTAIENPTSTDIAVLDAALYKGAVRYPRSAMLGDNATMYVFGHQSGLPVVKNQAFKEFNGIQNLEVGDEITVYSDTAEYTYLVTSVEMVKASEALIPLETGKRKLTLSTCDSFGGKSDRIVVNADFVSRVDIN